MATITLDDKSRFKRFKSHYEYSIGKEQTDEEYLDHLLGLYEYNNKLGEMENETKIRH